MPCNSDYMAANCYEREISRVACLLDELEGAKWERSWWDGYHPRVYCKYDRDLGDTMVRELCSALQNLDVTKYSLEMQIWWRDHRAADKVRIKNELAKAKTKAAREIALAKLTLVERHLLGIEKEPE